MFDIGRELSLKNYDEVIKYVNEIQKDLIHNLYVGDDKKLEQLSLMSNHILNFWFDSILKKKLWVALVRCGAWIGTLETIQKIFYEQNKKRWFDKLRERRYIIE